MMSRMRPEWLLPPKADAEKHIIRPWWIQGGSKLLTRSHIVSHWSQRTPDGREYSSDDDKPDKRQFGE